MPFYDIPQQIGMSKNLKQGDVIQTHAMNTNVSCRIEIAVKLYTVAVFSLNSMS